MFLARTCIVDSYHKNTWIKKDCILSAHYHFNQWPDSFYACWGYLLGHACSFNRLDIFSRWALLGRQLYFPESKSSYPKYLNLIAWVPLDFSMLCISFYILDVRLGSLIRHFRKIQQIKQSIMYIREPKTFWQIYFPARVSIALESVKSYYIEMLFLSVPDIRCHSMLILLLVVTQSSRFLQVLENSYQWVPTVLC